MNNPCIIDLFAGCGGMSLGFEMAGFKTVVAVEKDLAAAKTYGYNHPFVNVITEDITTITDLNAIVDKDIVVERDCGCSTIKLDDRLAVCVGWSDGWDEDDVCNIHSNDEPTFCICGGIKVHTSDALSCDYDFINYPYTNDDVWDTGVAISPEQDYISLAEWFLQQYEEMKGYTIHSNGFVEEY